MAIRGIDEEPTPSVSRRATARPIDAPVPAPTTTSTATQLALELEPGAARARRSRPSGRTSSACGATPFHPMCSYLASFPAALAHAFIARYSRPGDVVLDPFSGRGTTPLQAAAEGRIGVGNDLNPFAHLLTAAKVEPATRRRGRDPPRRAAARLGAGRVAALAAGEADRGRPRSQAGPASRRGPEPVPAEVALAFHPRTLAQLLFVRTPSTSTTASDRFLAAAITGILHGKSASYLSELMPNTFSMAPRYVRDFAARTAFDVAGARRLRRPRAQARPALPRSPCRRPRASRSSATPATPGRGPGPRCAPGACPIGPASSSPRRRTCGS